MEKDEWKIGKKMSSSVWLGGKGGEKNSGVSCFLSKLTKSQSPQNRKKIGVKIRGKFLD